MVTRLAYFVSPHGFGHAARAAAVMDALLVLRPDVHFDVFTLTPEWFFADSVGRGYSYHSLCTDVGLAQHGQSCVRMQTSWALSSSRQRFACRRNRSARSGMAREVPALVARTPRTAPDAVRQQLGLPPDARYVVITMGGVDRRYPFLDRLKRYHDVWFVVPGGDDRHVRRDNVVLLPPRSTLYHPDLVAGSDTLVGKLGYSTLAEAYRAGAPLGFICRPAFRESDVLAKYARAHIASVEVSEAEFESGDWDAFLPELLSRPRRTAPRPNGADEIASFVESQLPGPVL